jgi:hypothetical protein
VSLQAYAVNFRIDVGAWVACAALLFVVHKCKFRLCAIGSCVVSALQECSRECRSRVVHGMHMHRMQSAAMLALQLQP